MAAWLLIGPAKNLELGMQRGIWGLPPRNIQRWSLIEPGDTLFFYATAPIQGIVGWGLAVDTAQDDTPLWPEERRGQARFPLRIVFEQTTVIPIREWQLRRVPIGAGLVWHGAMQHLTDEQDRELKKLLLAAVASC